MTPSDRLAEIETTYNELFHDQGIMSDDVAWLIARVKRLTEALEEIYEWPATTLNQEIARKALEDGGE